MTRERGSAVVEFVVLAVVLAVPVTGALAAVLTVHPSGSLPSPRPLRRPWRSRARAGTTARRASRPSPVARFAGGVMTDLSCEPWCALARCPRDGHRHSADRGAPWATPLQVTQQHSQVVDRFAAPDLGDDRGSVLILGLAGIVLVVTVVLVAGDYRGVVLGPAGSATVRRRGCSGGCSGDRPGPLLPRRDRWIRLPLIPPAARVRAARWSRRHGVWWTYGSTEETWCASQ
jgi:hypothetical protein